MPDEFYKEKYFELLEKRMAALEGKMDELLAIKYWLLGIGAVVSVLFNLLWEPVKDFFTKR